MHGAFAYRAVAAVLAIGISTAPCAAQEYPTRSITLVVGFAAGGFADGVARMLGSKLSERLGQNVIVENRSGAGGNIAAAMVTKAPADGYTLLVTTTGFAINETLSKDKGFSLGDLKPITIPAWAPETLNVPAKSEAKSLTELMRMAKTKPVTFGSPGVRHVRPHCERLHVQKPGQSRRRARAIPGRRTGFERGARRACRRVGRCDTWLCRLVEVGSDFAV